MSKMNTACQKAWDNLSSKSKAEVNTMGEAIEELRVAMKMDIIPFLGILGTLLHEPLNPPNEEGNPQGDIVSYFPGGVTMRRPAPPKCM